MHRLKNRICIVTGAALGIGRACARRMAEEGARIALFDLLDKEGRELERELRANGHDAAYWHVDVADEAAVKAAIDDVAERFGGLHVLVNNAGIAGANKPTHELSEAHWDQVMAVDVKGVFFGTKHAVPHMKRAGHGSIINLSSIYGLVGAPDYPPYHAAKGAVRLMSKTDALIYAPDAIRVNSVHPGFVQTLMVDNFLRDRGATDLAATRRQIDQLHPLGHMGEPDDVAWGVVYLASDEAKFVTGSELVIDGGYTAR